MFKMSYSCLTVLKWTFMDSYLLTFMRVSQEIWKYNETQEKRQFALINNLFQSACCTLAFKTSLKEGYSYRVN